MTVPNENGYRAMRFVPLVVGILLTLSLAMAAWPSHVTGQTPPAGDPRSEMFERRFNLIVELNKDKIGNFYTMPVGTPYDLPGDSVDFLRAGQTLGIWGQEFQKIFKTTYEEYERTGQVAAPVVRQAAIPPANRPQVVATADEGFPWSNLMLWLLVAAMAIGLVVLAYKLMRTKLSNPVTSGPAMREGGITRRTAPEHFQNRAAQLTGTPGTAGYVPPENIRLISITRGRGYGPFNVTFRGRNRPELKLLTGEMCYEAIVEYPDRRRETMMCLEGCANDIVFAGTRYRMLGGFRFVPDGTPVPIPQTEQATTATVGGTQARWTDDVITLTDGAQTVEFGAKDWSIKKGPEGGVIISDVGRSDVEWRGGRIYGARLPEEKAPEVTASTTDTTGETTEVPAGTQS